MMSRQKDHKTKRQKDKKTKIQKKYKKIQRPKREFNIVTSGQFRTLAMFVKWLGWPKKFNQWVPENNVRHLLK